MLSPNNKANLMSSIQDFLVWLSGKLDVTPSRKYESFMFSDPDDSDWFMDVPHDQKSPVRFNTQALKQCTYEYYKLIVLHECFHLFTQDIPNKLDAKRVKDDFGDMAMVMFDVEADYYVSIFYKDVLRITLVEYLQILYQGATVFKDKDIRHTKFERFIASKLSIVRPHLCPYQYDRRIYLVTTRNVVTEGSIHFVVTRETHFQRVQMNIPKDRIDRLVACYELGEGVDEQNYITEIIEFCSNALEMPIPDAILEDIGNIDA